MNWSILYQRKENTSKPPDREVDMYVQWILSDKILLGDR